MSITIHGQHAPHIASRVAAGIRWLASVDPDWRDHVDPETLDIWSNEYCMIGQIFGPFHETQAAIDMSDETAQARGFLCLDFSDPHMDAEYAALTACWLDQLDPPTDSPDTKLAA